MDGGFPDAVYYEAAALNYPLGRMLREKYAGVAWREIDSHNAIPALRAQPNAAFPALKRHLIVGVRKTHQYAENHKVSDYLVPYTSSGCSAMCLYCYLVCTYNKCAYMRLFVNREQMMDKLLRTGAASPRALTFEVGSNSDLVLENTISGNLPWTIEAFGREGKGRITFPTKFSAVAGLLNLDHRGKTLFRMSVNPEEIIQSIELGTAPLKARIAALNAMAEAGYPVGLLIAPVILLDDWRALYARLIEHLAGALSPAVRARGFIEIILMTYGFVQNEINRAAFPGAPALLDREKMAGTGRGKYRYKEAPRREAEDFLRAAAARLLPGMEIRYVV